VYTPKDWDCVIQNADTMAPMTGISGERARRGRGIELPDTYRCTGPMSGMKGLSVQFRPVPIFLLITLVFLLTPVTSSCVTTWKNTTLTFTILDVGTTTYALKSNPNGYNELNPITGQNLVLTYVINACFLYALDTTLKEDHEWVIPALLKIASATWNVYTLTGGGHAEQGNSMQTRSPELSTRQLHPGLLRGHRTHGTQ